MRVNDRHCPGRHRASICFLKMLVRVWPDQAFELTVSAIDDKRRTFRPLELASRVLVAIRD